MICLIPPSYYVAKPGFNPRTAGSCKNLALYPPPYSYSALISAQASLRPLWFYNMQNSQCKGQCICFSGSLWTLLELSYLYNFPLELPWERNTVMSICNSTHWWHLQLWGTVIAAYHFHSGGASVRQCFYTLSFLCRASWWDGCFGGGWPCAHWTPALF